MDEEGQRKEDSLKPRRNVSQDRSTFQRKCTRRTNAEDTGHWRAWNHRYGQRRRAIKSPCAPLFERRRLPWLFRSVFLKLFRPWSSTWTNHEIYPWTHHPTPRFSLHLPMRRAVKMRDVLLLPILTEVQRANLSFKGTVVSWYFLNYFQSGSILNIFCVAFNGG